MEKGFSTSLFVAHSQYGSRSDSNHDEIHDSHEDKRDIFFRAMSEKQC
jgi:hypothetical protein